MRPLRAYSFALVFLLLGGADAHAGIYHSEELQIPMAAAGAQGLEAVLIRPNRPGKYPLAIISHGTPRNSSERPKRTPWAMLPEAREFARRGWAAVIVMRRGFGGSGGKYVEDTDCPDPHYVASARNSSADLAAAIDWLTRRPDIDGTRVIAVGPSTGGLAAIALSADPPPGLKAAISFAGGAGSIGDFNVCHEDRLIAAFARFGKTSRVPTLWVYAQNDRYFAPKLAKKLRDAFIRGGGKVRFVKVAPFGDDGHHLFSLFGIPVWSRTVDSFLAKERLTLRSKLLPLDLPPLTAPAGLSKSALKYFHYYRMSGQHKAFAIGPNGSFGWRTGERFVEDAKSKALDYCGTETQPCRLVFVDDAPVRAETAAATPASPVLSPPAHRARR